MVATLQRLVSSQELFSKRYIRPQFHSTRSTPLNHETPDKHAAVDCLSKCAVVLQFIIERSYFVHNLVIRNLSIPIFLKPFGNPVQPIGKHLGIVRFDNVV